MKIEFNYDLVEFKPETKEEEGDLQKLWNVVLDCTRSNVKLVPVGEYIAGRDEIARFHLED